MNKETKETFDLNTTELGALKHGIHKYGTRYSSIQKQYFPNYLRKNIQNYVERHNDLLQYAKKRKKELAIEKKKRTRQESNRFEL